MTAEDAYQVNLAWTDLVVAGRPSAIDQFLAEIDRLLPTEWKRNTVAEQQAVERNRALSPGRCYTRKLAKHDVQIWLIRSSNYRVQSPLVEPVAPEDNAESIRDFRQRILEPATELCGLVISRYSLGPLSLVPADVMYRLWAFYDSSGFQWPPTGEALKRWREFVVSVYQTHAALDRGELSTWLQGKGWSAGDADALITRLYSEAALLSEYDDLRQPV